MPTTQQQFSETIDGLNRQLDDAKAETARLREALEQIEEELHHPRTPQERVASRVARRALGLDPPDEE